MVRAMPMVVRTRVTLLEMSMPMVVRTRVTLLEMSMSLMWMKDSVSWVRLKLLLPTLCLRMTTHTWPQC